MPSPFFARLNLAVASAGAVADNEVIINVIAAAKARGFGQLLNVAGGLSAVAYLNADGSVTGGQVSASAAPSLKGLFTDATKAVAHPKGGTVYEQWVAGSKNGSSPAMGNLGGGSDHVGFYTHVGVPSGGMSFRGSTPNYHSNYDTFAWYERFADTVDGLSLAVRRCPAPLSRTEM